MKKTAYTSDTLSSIRLDTKLWAISPPIIQGIQGIKAWGPDFQTVASQILKQNQHSINLAQ